MSESSIEGKNATRIADDAAVSENGLRYLQAARDLVPLIEAEADAMERERRISSKVVEGMRDAGLFWMMVPEAAGGGGLRVTEGFRVIQEIAAADGSTGWCLHAVASGSAIQSGLLPAPGTEFFFGGDTKQVTCGAAIPIGRGTVEDGGIRISGRWPFGTASDFSDYVGGGVTMYDENGDVMLTADGIPDMRFAFAPRDQITFYGNWNSSGLVGTGSVDYSMEDVFVSNDLIVPLSPTPPVRSEPMFQLGLAPLSATGHNAVVLGIARRALHEVATITADKVRVGYPVPVGDYAVFQSDFAKHEAEYQAARAYALSAVDSALDFAEREGSVTSEHASRILQSASWSHKVADRVVAFARLWSGTQAFREPSRVGRAARDIGVATQHLIIDDINFVNAAPDLLASWKTL
jgi:alkylation response protein AidB-like acyl-CoA dehydrogenase